MITVIIITAIFTFYITKLFYYIPAYENMERHIDYNLQDHPDQFACWNWKGILEREKGRMFSAMYYWSIALRYQPTSFRVNYNMAILFKDLGYHDQAQKFFKDAEAGLDKHTLNENIEHLKREENDLLVRMGQRPASRQAVPSGWKNYENSRMVSRINEGMGWIKKKKGRR